MVSHLKLVFLACALGAAVLPAAAEACGPHRIVGTHQANQLLQVSQSASGEFSQAAAQVEQAAKDCPDTGWIRLLAASAEMTKLQKLLPVARTDEEKEARFAYVERAADHLMAYRENYTDHFLRGNTHLSLRHRREASQKIVAEMMRSASQGFVHPLASGAPLPGKCDPVVELMAEEASHPRYTGNMASTRLLEAIAGACRQADDRSDWRMLRHLANRYVELIRAKRISDRAEIQRLLRIAYRDTRQLLRGEEPSVMTWSEQEESALMELLYAYNVDLPFVGTHAEIARADWFKPEHAGSDAVIYSIALALSRQWTPLAAGVTDAPQEDVMRALAPIIRDLTAMGQEADAAGQTVAGRRSIITAIDAFQNGDVRTPETASLPGFPSWMASSSKNGMQSKIDEAK